MPKPSVGRIVHYVAYGTPGGEYKPEHRAAVVTQVYNETSVALMVINPTGMFFQTSILQDEGEKKPGTWHWPEREEG
ncbi:MAG: hypothetical protein SFU83_23700 [Meiothermus sp.]|nr:hypothetical protein [Meiothermus sp.]